MLRIFNTKSTIKPKTTLCFNDKLNDIYYKNKKIDPVGYSDGQYYKFKKSTESIDDNFINKNMFLTYEKINNNINNGVDKILQEEFYLQQKRDNLKLLNEKIGYKLKDKLLKGKYINSDDAEELINIINKLQNSNENEIESILLTVLFACFLAILFYKYISDIEELNAKISENKPPYEKIYKEDIIEIKDELRKLREEIYGSYCVCNEFDLENYGCHCIRCDGDINQIKKQLENIRRNK